MTTPPMVEASGPIKERLAVFSEACASQDDDAVERALLETLDAAIDSSVDMEALSSEAAHCNRVREAVEAVEGAVRRYGRSAPIHECLSRLWLLEGALPLALHHAREAISMDHSSAFAHSALGQCLFQQGQFDPGVTHLKRAVALAPGFASFQYNLALSLRHLRRSEESIAVLMNWERFENYYFRMLRLGRQRRSSSA